MPRPDLGRRLLQVRLLPSARAALGPRPSERARELLEEWAAKGGEIFPPNDEGPASEPTGPSKADRAPTREAGTAESHQHRADELNMPGSPSSCNKGLASQRGRG